MRCEGRRRSQEDEVVSFVRRAKQTKDGNFVVASIRKNSNAIGTIGGGGRV